MKKLSFLLTLSLLFLFSCSVDEIGTNEKLNTDYSKKEQKETVTLGFNLVFTGSYDYVGPSENCPNLFNVINNGVGTGTHFGKVTSHFDFCIGPDNSYPNGYINSYFEDENGDKLYVYVEGFVLGGRVPGIPNYANSYFKDSFEILGGTGRFEGAKGGGMTNDFNSDKDPYSHHHWKGKITMLKSK